MAAAKIRINSERTEVEFVTPSGQLFGDDFDPDGLTVLADDDGQIYLGVAGSHQDLKDHTVYRLVECVTVLEENAIIEEDEDDDDEEEIEDGEDEDEEETIPVK